MSNDDPLEKVIERKVCKVASERGILTYKFTSPARALVPDRLFLAPIPDFLQPIIAEYVRFVEFKRAGKKPTAIQAREHDRLRALGFTVDVVDSVTDGNEVVIGMLGG